MHGRNVQIRNVPEQAHRRLKMRAAEAGLSLSEYLGRELARLASLPTLAEISARFRARAHSELGGRAAAAVREGREGRDE